MGDSELYQAILQRRSVRRYQRAPLDPVARARVAAIIDRVEPLLADNAFLLRRQDHDVDGAMLHLLGGYGKLITPPHLLAPCVTSGRHALVDLGYRMEQVAVGLTSLGLGSCFIGVLPNERLAAELFDLPPAGRIGALLVYGYLPKRGLDRALNGLLHGAMRAGSRLPLDALCYDEEWQPTGAPDELCALLLAARRAPSAVNAQPWRFAWRDGALLVLVKRHNSRYGGKIKQEYRYYDGGICMANLAMAARALDRALSWSLLSDGDLDCPDHLEPLARATLA